MSLLPNSYNDFESLVKRIRNWESVLKHRSFQEKRQYVHEVNRRYDAMANTGLAQEIVELRLLRSLWAKNIAEILIRTVNSASSNELQQVCSLIGSLRTIIRSDAVRQLLARQTQVGDHSSSHAIATLLAEHAPSEDARTGLIELGSSTDFFRRLGPKRISKFRPSRKTSGFDPSQWLTNSEMTEVDFVDGNPDRIRVRGIELHSGDIGIIELNHPGDGLLESFLKQP
ncbi:MAG TPA: hypothetical protein VM260_17845, partial [Pirellula sp.]|nr:hypothetical protein [Pirellula sp.]